MILFSLLPQFFLAQDPGSGGGALPTNTEEENGPKGRGPTPPQEPTHDGEEDNIPKVAWYETTTENWITNPAYTAAVNAGNSLANALSGQLTSSVNAKRHGQVDEDTGKLKSYKGIKVGDFKWGGPKADWSGGNFGLSSFTGNSSLNGVTTGSAFGDQADSSKMSDYVDISGAVQAQNLINNTDKELLDSITKTTWYTVNGKGEYGKKSTTTKNEDKTKTR